jgi:hypothetical protein
MKLASIFIICTIFFSVALAQAATVNIEGMPIKIGDTVENVQQALSTNLEPEKKEDSTSFASIKPSHKSELRLKTKGIWVFFEKGKVYTIRVDKPFSGSVGGIKLGDPSSKIEKILGPPVKRGTLGKQQTYTYYFDDITTTQINVNQDEEVETVFFIK